MSVYARLRLASSGAQTVHAGEIICISDQPNSRGVFDIQKIGQPILIRTGAQFRRARDVQHVTVVYRGAGHIDMPFSSSTPARALAPLYFDGLAVSADRRGTPIGYALHGCNSDRIHMEIIWDPQALNFPGTTGFSTDRDVRILKNEDGKYEEVDFKTFKREILKETIGTHQAEGESNPHKIALKDALKASKNFDEFEKTLLDNLEEHQELANGLVRITSPGTDAFEQLKTFYIQKRLKQAKFYLYATDSRDHSDLEDVMPYKIREALIEEGYLNPEDFQKYEFSKDIVNHYDLLNEALEEAIQYNESIADLAIHVDDLFYRDYTTPETAVNLWELLVRSQIPADEDASQRLKTVFSEIVEADEAKRRAGSSTIAQTAEFRTDQATPTGGPFA